MVIFDELRLCPAVMVNWQILGQSLGLIDEELIKIRRHSPDLRKRCYATLRMSFEILKGSEPFHRDIVLRYIKALQRIGCPRIAGKHRGYLKEETPEPNSGITFSAGSRELLPSGFSNHVQCIMILDCHFLLCVIHETMID